jgi:hypothetical protein
MGSYHRAGGNNPRFDDLWNRAGCPGIPKEAQSGLNPAGAVFWPGYLTMSVDNVRHQVNSLTPFTSTVVVAFVAALPMTLVIVWICS